MRVPLDFSRCKNGDKGEKLTPHNYVQHSIEAQGCPVRPYRAIPKFYHPRGRSCLRSEEEGTLWAAQTGLAKLQRAQCSQKREDGLRDGRADVMHWEQRLNRLPPLCRRAAVRGEGEGHTHWLIGLSAARNLLSSRIPWHFGWAARPRSPAFMFLVDFWHKKRARSTFYAVTESQLRKRRRRECAIC